MNKTNNKTQGKIDLNLYKVMLTIAEEGTTIAAAARLNLSQSAISHALSRLREMLDDPVFVKHGRKLVLTPFGKSILPTVKQSLSSLIDCSSKTIEFDPQHSQMEFSLGFRDILEFLILPDLLKPLREMASEIIIKSERLILGDIEERLLASELDLVIDLETPTSTKIESEEITREALCVLIGPSHPCFNNKRLTIQEFSVSDHALVSLNRRERAYVDSRIRVAGVERRVVMQCEHYLPAAKTVEATDLLLTMPYSYAVFLANILDVKILPIPFECDPIPIRMYWRKDTADEAYMLWLRNQLKNIMQSTLS
ncbi:LysR family transcriptional regulator [Aliikangiella marina]|uniref:LysR family transcriptional regulator n=1 Tax=Aliikangiella marina TaxID=1712262 RepID=A0A545TH86_9GAMM|nr:LysR family transcriptional regulator [Aliikangiella marina]TQV76589.1 LysR family transcriptional regulator [Aliikangiella marina]